MDKNIVFRVANIDDTAGILNVYGWYVKNSISTYAWAVPTLDEYKIWVKDTMAKCPLIVACDENGEIVGFACAHPWRVRESFDWSAETTIYIKNTHRAMKIGRPLYNALLAMLKDQGYWNAYALVASPNPASDGLHKNLEFILEGDNPHCAYKFGQWTGLKTWALPLIRSDVPPQLLKKPSEIDSDTILQKAMAGVSWRDM